MVQFEGEYKRTKSENYDEFLSKLGLNFMIRKAAALTTPILTVSKTSTGKWLFKTETKVKTTHLEFNIGQDWIETMPNEQKVNCSASLDGNTITIVQNPLNSDGKKVTVIREFTHEGINVQMKIEEVVCKQFYERLTK